MKTCILIPIKTINKRLPGKNTKKLAGKHLYEYLFSTLKKIGPNLLDDVYIDSSDNEILEIAENWEFKTLKRPKRYNEDDIAGDDLINRVIEELDYEIIGQFHVTSPFIKKETIEKAIKTIKNNPGLDSVFGVIPHYNRFWYKKNPVNHNPLQLKRTQDLEPILEEADFYFFRKESFKKYKKRVCGKFETINIEDKEGVDIDNLEDFKLAEFLIKNNLVKND